MHIKTLKLFNFRCFDNILLNLESDLTVIVGRNAAGKSALLDALAVSFGPYLSRFDEGKGNGFHKLDARRLPAQGFEMESQFPVCLEVLGVLPPIDGKPRPASESEPQQMSLFSDQDTVQSRSPARLLEDTMHSSAEIVQNALSQQSWSQDLTYWRRELTGPNNNTTIKDAFFLSQYGDQLQTDIRNGKPVVLPVLSYYGTGRLWSVQKLTESRKHALSESRTVGYRECLNPSSSFKEFAYWFKQLNLAINNEIDLERQGLPSKHTKALEARRKAVVNAVETCLSSGSDWERIAYYGAEDEILAYSKKVGYMPVAHLSDGIRNILALIADLAFRCCKLNGHLGEMAALQTPGVVMIDELDLHLHPAWQQTIVPALREAFPKVQFILSTHSPHLLSTVPQRCVRILNQGQLLLASDQTEGAQSQAVLEDVFGVSAWPPVKIVDKLKKYLNWVSQKQYGSSEAQALRKELNTHYGPEHEDLINADLLIARFEALKQAQSDK